MFILDSNALAENALHNAEAFVTFWSQFYGSEVRILGGPERIDYLAELSLGQDLTCENCRRLLRWKDARYLTHVILNGPNKDKPNPRVQRVLDVLPVMNQFRRGQCAEDEFLRQTRKVFPNGFVWRVFLFHIAQPHAYPIADQHVFRAFRLHCHEQGQTNWEFYQRYRAYFREIAEACDVRLELTDVPKLKRIDAALMAFGRFLGEYYRE